MGRKILRQSVALLALLFVPLFAGHAQLCALDSYSGAISAATSTTIDCPLHRQLTQSKGSTLPESAAHSGECCLPLLPGSTQLTSQVSSFELFASPPFEIAYVPTRLFSTAPELRQSAPPEQPIIRARLSLLAIGLISGKSSHALLSRLLI